MSRGRYTPEQIIGKLREAEVVFCPKSSRREGLEGFRYTDHIWNFPRSDDKRRSWQNSDARGLGSHLWEGVFETPPRYSTIEAKKADQKAKGFYFG